MTNSKKSFLSSGCLLFVSTFCLLLFLSLISSGCRAVLTEEPPGHLPVILAADHGFLEDNQVSLQQLEEAYGFHFDEVYLMAMGLTHEALRAGDVTAARGYATDAKQLELDLVSLVDDAHIFPANNPAPVIREEVIEDYPEISSCLARVTPLLNNENMRRLNYRVDIGGMLPQQVARDWLLSEGLIERPGRPASGLEGVVLASKEYSEQNLLAWITYYMLLDCGVPVMEPEIYVGTRTIRTAMEREDLDLYWEYISTAWWEIFLEEEVVSDAEQLFRRVAVRDLEHGLIWLDFAPMQKTPVIMIRGEDAREQGIRNLSQFADWVIRQQKEGAP